MKDKLFYETLLYFQKNYPAHYAKSGLAEIIMDVMNGDFAVKLPKLEKKGKADDGNANTRDRYMGILIKEFNNPLEKTENYRILFNKICDIFGEQKAQKFLGDDILGVIYTHNSQNISTKPYCFAYDFDMLVEKGAYFTDIADRPAQHLDSFIQHVIEFVAVTCRETTGAVGMPALFPYMWYFWNKDVEEGYVVDPKKYLKQQIQMLVYKLNGSEMRMNESAFTNVSCMDESYIENFFGDRIFPNGEPVVKFIDEIIDLEVFFLECVNDILENKVMTFPVITDCCLFDKEKQEFVNEKTARRFSDLNIRWENANEYDGTDISTLSTCCRVLNNIDDMNTKLSGFSNFIGGSDLNIGSVSVITINLPHWAHTCRRDILDKDVWLNELIKQIIAACDYLHCIRAVIQDLIDKGALKLYDRELAKIERQFNTVGFIGLYDAAKVLGFTEDRDILEFEASILDIFKTVTEQYSAEYDYSINIEQIPGESACVKLAQKDKLTFGDEAIGTDCYSNQWIPLSEYRSINDRSEFAARLDKLCGGGSILHLNIEAPFTNPEQRWQLKKELAKKGVIYKAFNIRISVCEDEHGFHGDTCWCGKPKVGEATRPVGFITLVKNWIPSRIEEYRTRVFLPSN